jgi:hypothetical protein
MSQYPTERGLRQGAHANNAMHMNPTYGESQASGPAPTTAGHHKHDILNKLDPRVDSTKDRHPMAPMNANNDIPEGTYGPHRSRIANALDPRVDSDMDGSGRQPQGQGMMMPPHQQGSMTGGGAAMHGGRTGMNNMSGAPEGTYGPHNSRIANALDPRVDSDRDGRAAATGGYAQHQQQPATGYGQPINQGHGVGHQRQHGLHQQDPVYGSSGVGHNTHGGVANAAMSGPGPAPNTAGPHRSDLLNKLDPRFDSKTGARKEPHYQ